MAGSYVAVTVSSASRSPVLSVKVWLGVSNAVITQMNRWVPSKYLKRVSEIFSTVMAMLEPPSCSFHVPEMSGGSGSRYWVNQ